MKCQYQAVTSTTMRRPSIGRCSREVSAAHSKAIIPPARCTACAAVSKYTNELFGLVSTKKPRAFNSPHAIHCPTRNPKPNRTVNHRQGKLRSEERRVG